MTSNELEELKSRHTRWLYSFGTSRGQTEDSLTILNLIEEINILTCQSNRWEKLAHS